jgi:hypothetical protein
MEGKLIRRRLSLRRVPYVYVDLVAIIRSYEVQVAHQKEFATNAKHRRGEYLAIDSKSRMNRKSDFLSGHHSSPCALLVKIISRQSV